MKKQYGQVGKLISKSLFVVPVYRQHDKYLRYESGAIVIVSHALGEYLNSILTLRRDCSVDSNYRWYYMLRHKMRVREY